MDHQTNQETQPVFATGVRVGCPWLENRRGEPEIMLIVHLGDMEGDQDEVIFAMFDPQRAVGLARKILEYATKINNTLN